MLSLSRAALALSLCATGVLAQQAPIDGDWAGTLKIGPQELRLVLHFRTEGTNLTARMDVPDQGVVGLPITSASFTDRVLKFEIANLGASFQGKQEGANITGTFSQRNANVPLVLERTIAEKPKPRNNEESWLGEIVLPNGTVTRMLLKTWAEDDQSRHGSIESPGQPMAPLPAANFVQTGTDVKFQLRAYVASYEGTFNADHTAIEGKLTQGGQAVPLIFRKTTATAAAPKSANRSIEGIWEGAIHNGATSIRIALKIKKDPSGVFTGTLDSIDTSLSDVPLSDVTFKENLYAHVEIKRMAATYDSKLSDDGTSLSGTWTQGPASLQLTLKKVEKQTEVRRPQMPQPPFPYAVEEVSFANPKGIGVQLSGTLTKPNGPGPFPAAILITGSGPQDRDESLMGHKPFFVLADYLTRRGIAVLRYDDRGVGKSTGRFQMATTADFATDAEAAIALLKSRSDIDPKRIGLIGHSEGGTIAPMIASRNSDVTFVVMLAGPGVTGAEIMVSQVKALAQASGLGPEAVAKAEADQRKVMTILVKEPDDAKAEQQIAAVAGANPQIKALLSPWYRYFAAYDPKYVIEKVTQPALALNGEKDTQVVADQNLAAIHAANANIETKKLPGLNHLFQTAKTGLPNEYGLIEETFAPSALQTIGDWIAKVTQAK